MENKNGLLNPLERKIKFIYDLGADVTFEFENGDTIRINKTVLAFHTDFLSDVFFGPAPSTKFQVENFDSETFRTFLDCLFGLKEYSVLDSLLIYPIAHEYQVKESLEKCVEVLKPKIMDENVSLILNLALFYKDDILEKTLMSFIKAEIGVVGFIDTKAYRDLLEPTSMCRLIEEIDFDSYVLKIICEWAENYIKKHCKKVDVSSFFVEIGISSKIESCFVESMESLFGFFDFKLAESNQILQGLRNAISSSDKLPDKSEWVKLDEETFTETIEFTHPLGYSFQEHENGLSIKISTNKVFFEDFKLNKNPVLNVKTKFWCRVISVPLREAENSSHLRGCYNFNHFYNWDRCTCFVPLKVPAFDCNEVEETDLMVSSGELVFKRNLKALENRFQEIKSVEITYTFKNLYKSRILKTSLKGNFKSADGLYFTRAVSFRKIKNSVNS